MELQKGTKVGNNNSYLFRRIFIKAKEQIVMLANIFSCIDEIHMNLWLLWQTYIWFKVLEAIRKFFLLPNLLDFLYFYRWYRTWGRCWKESWMVIEAFFSRNFRICWLPVLSLHGYVTHHIWDTILHHSMEPQEQ